MVFIFVVDTSGSMTGSKIGAVNEAIKEAIPEIKSVSDENTDAKIKVAAISFSTSSKWMSQEPVEVEKFRWDPVSAGGATDLGDAFKKINEKLTRERGGFMEEAAGSYAPVFLLLSDGQPTDDYKTALGELKRNAWFKVAIKIALAIGEDVDESVLAEFTGNIETVLPALNSTVLKKMIKTISVRASQIGSRSANVNMGAGDGCGSDLDPEDNSKKQEEAEEMIRDIGRDLERDNKNSEWGNF
ncbi:MAG: VWA domain-containing protein [Synergistaceae bacterium]|nr:VWA domain-containing protein [Synergistaceae bacterium]